MYAVRDGQSSAGFAVGEDDVGPGARVGARTGSGRRACVEHRRIGPGMSYRAAFLYRVCTGLTLATEGEEREGGVCRTRAASRGILARCIRAAEAGTRCGHDWQDRGAHRDATLVRIYTRCLIFTQ